MYFPVGYHVLVEPDEVDEMTKGGIYIPKTSLDREQGAITEGVVVAIAPGAWLDTLDGKPWCKVGDRVLFAKYGGREYEKDIEGTRNKKKYRFLLDKDIIAVWEDEDHTAKEE